MADVQIELVGGPDDSGLIAVPEALWLRGVVPATLRTPLRGRPWPTIYVRADRRTREGRVVYGYWPAVTPRREGAAVGRGGAEPSAPPTGPGVGPGPG